MINTISNSLTNKEKIAKSQLLNELDDEVYIIREEIDVYKQALISAYDSDDTADIEYYSNMLSHSQNSLRYRQGLDAVIRNPLVTSILKGVRFQRKKEKELLAQQPIDIAIKRAKRAHEQRQIEADAWFDSLPLEEQLERINNFNFYDGCPVGNFSNTF